MDEDHVKERAKKLSAAFIAAMASAISTAGSQKALSERVGIHQSRISDSVDGNYDLNNITVGTLITIEEFFDKMEKRILAMFRKLGDDEKVLCFEMMSRTFGERFKEE